VIIGLAVVGIPATGLGLAYIGLVIAISTGTPHGSASSNGSASPPSYPLIRTLTDPGTTGKLRRIGAGPYEYGTSGTYAVAFSPDGRTLAIGDASGRTYLWDTATWTPATTLTNPLVKTKNVPRTVSAVAYSPNGQMLATGYGQLATYLWDVARRTLTAILTSPNDICCTTAPVVFSPDGRTLAVGGGDGQTFLWDASTGKLLAILTTARTAGGPNDVFSLAFSPNGRTLAVGGINSSTYLWNVATRKQIAALPDPGSTGVNAVVFSPDGKTLAAGDENGMIYFWNVATRSLITTQGMPGTGNRSIESLAFSPDGQTLAAADYDGRTYLWGEIIGRPTGGLVGVVLFATLTEPHGYPYGLAFSPDGKTLATLSPYGSAYLWNLSPFPS
jgi:WD40 repeat protein